MTESAISETATPESAIPETLADSLRSTDSQRLQSSSSFGACLLPLLSSLGWLGDRTELVEALPHFAERLDLIDFRNTLAELGYQSHRHSGRMSRIDPRLLPCLFLVRGRAPILVHSKSADGYIVFDSEAQGVRRTDGEALTGYYYTFERIKESEAVQPDSRSWLWTVLRRFRGEAAVVVLTSLLSSFFGLAVPLFVMAVYDLVIPAASPSSLFWLAPGVALAVTVDFAGRRIRARALAHIAGRFDYLIATETFRRILELPPASAETSTHAAQIARLRGFQGMRDLVNSPILSAGLEVPLIIAALVVIGVVAGGLVVIPVVALVLFLLFGAVVVPAVRRAEVDAAKARSARDQLVTELVTRQRAVRKAVVEDSFFERLRPLSARTAYARAQAAARVLALQTIGHGLVIGSGLALLLFGTEGVVNGTVSTGALVASMALIWRILVPIQLMFQALPRLSQVGTTAAQINRLMKLAPEARNRSSHVEAKRFESTLSVQRVSVRYRDDAAPALLAVSLDVRPGELIAVTGASGAGKTTLLKVVAGLLMPQAGNVFYGGVEQRHIEPVELRRSIAYLPQTCHLFHGTVAQNLRLANRVASDADIRAAADSAGVLDEIEALPEGFDTWIGDEKIGGLPESFRQKLALARIWLKDAPIVLLDEPQQNLDAEGDERLIRTLGALRGTRTVMIVTHRPSLMRFADRVISLDDGRMSDEPNRRRRAAIQEEAAQ